MTIFMTISSTPQFTTNLAFTARLAFLSPICSQFRVPFLIPTVYTIVLESRSDRENKAKFMEQSLQEPLFLIQECKVLLLAWLRGNANHERSKPRSRSPRRTSPLLIVTRQTSWIPKRVHRHVATLQINNLLNSRTFFPSFSPLTRDRCGVCSDSYMSTEVKQADQIERLISAEEVKQCNTNSGVLISTFLFYFCSLISLTTPYCTPLPPSLG